MHISTNVFFVQLKIAVGNDVKIERPKYDYLDFRPRDPDLDFEGN